MRSSPQAQGLLLWLMVLSLPRKTRASPRLRFLQLGSVLRVLALLRRLRLLVRLQTLCRRLASSLSNLGDVMCWSLLEIWSAKLVEKFYASTVLSAISNTDYGLVFVVVKPGELLGHLTA